MTILDKDRWVEELKKIIEEYTAKMPVYFHPSCYKELMRLLVESGSEMMFLKKLNEYLATICSNQDTFTSSNGMEKLKGCVDVYSMRFKLTNKNIRILFTLCDGCLLALTAFHERYGKGVSSYEPYISVANTRLRDMTE